MVLCEGGHTSRGCGTAARVVTAGVQESPGAADYRDARSRGAEPMSEVLIARQPIFNADRAVVAYELLFRAPGENRAVIIDDEGATSAVVLNTFTEIGLDRVVPRERAWLNVSRDFVLGSFPQILPGDRVVLELLESAEVDERLVKSLGELRTLGYSIALDDFTWHEHRDPLLEIADFVKVDVLALDRPEVAQLVERLRGHDVRLLAEKVETHDDFRFCAELGFELFQGYFFCTPEVMAGRGIEANRMALLQLLGELQHPEVDFARLEELIACDVALSYRLLRYINSAYFGLRREIESIGRALVLLGTENVKLWATMTALAAVDDKPKELIVTALIRAKLTQLLGPAFDEHQDGQLFTLGLFSVLDAMMDAPMDEVLQAVPFPDDMTRALTQRHGRKGQLVELAIACERGDFARLLTDGQLEAGQIRDAYLEALDWATNTFEALTSEPAPA
jgi:EAL and modified HD-GYP domain-containing signal transduction protein